jgi:hypothetical protein
MTKIEKFQQAKATAHHIRNDVAQILGRDSPQNDKHSFDVKFTGLASESWNPMLFQIHVSHGYYGSSSGYSNSSDHLGKYLAASIQRHASALLEFASKLADDDAEKARKEAEDEAKAVLQTTAA